MLLHMWDPVISKNINEYFCQSCLEHWFCLQQLHVWSFEGLGGKNVLGIFIKSELCHNYSKFRLGFYLGMWNNVLDLFPLNFASFLRYDVCKTTHFCRHISVRPHMFCIMITCSPLIGQVFSIPWWSGYNDQSNSKSWKVLKTVLNCC